MAKFDADGSCEDGNYGIVILIIAILLIVSVVGLIGWIIYKIIQAICRAVDNKRIQKQNTPVVI